MLSFRPLQPVFLALLLPVASRAQSASPAPATVPRFFVGAGGAFGGYALPNTSAGHVFAFVPTVGMQLTPHLAAQLSGTYQLDHSYTTFTYDPKYPGWSTTMRTNRNRIVVVPILARYSLLRNPAHRFQLDVLGGVSLIRLTILSDVFPLDSNQQPLPSTQESTSTTNANITLGAGMRYALLPCLEATAGLEFNSLRFSWRPGSTTFGNVVAGVRYRFGRAL